MGAWIFGMHRRVVDRLPGCLAFGGGVAVDIAVADGRDRAPERVLVLGVQDGDHSVRFRGGYHCHESSAVDH